MNHIMNRCRMCGSAELSLILDLGETALANNFVAIEESGDSAMLMPLRLLLCGDCSLVQLADVVDPRILYSRYAYITSTSATMDSHLASQSACLLEATKMRTGGKVLEIASNTGLFLQKFRDFGCDVLGVEPAENISELAVASGIPTITRFFNSSTAVQIAEEWGVADLILGRHVFAHIDDLKDFINGLKAISHNRTLLSFEVPYLCDLLRKTEYDTIYHEHLSYISVRSLEALLMDSPFMLVGVEHHPIHGGSISFHLRLRCSGFEPNPSVKEALDIERKLALAEPQTWSLFSERVAIIRTELPRLIRKLKADGKRVIGYGASAKGNTLLNTCGLTSKDLDYIIDNTPFKQNKTAPGSRIPIVYPDRLLCDQPDYALLLAWNFEKDIINREVEFQRRGGRFIIPIPNPMIVPYSE